MDLPELEKLPIKKRSNEELDAIAHKKIKPVMDERQEKLGTDKEIIILEKERPTGTPKEYLPIGHLRAQPPAKKTNSSDISKKEVEAMQHQEWGGNWGKPRPDMAKRLAKN